jgi:hypothetical protein
MSGEGKEPTGWVAGQKVFEPASRGWSGYPGRALTIDRVTPSGRAVIGATQYNQDGRQIGSRYAARIVPFTEEHAAELALWGRRREADRLAEGIKWRSLSDEQLDIALPALRALAGEAQ